MLGYKNFSVLKRYICGGQPVQHKEPNTLVVKCGAIIMQVYVLLSYV